MVERCLICHENVEIAGNGLKNLTSVNCPRCGKYSVGGLAHAHLNGTKLTLRQKANISGWLRQNQPFKITDSNLKQILSIKTPSFHERADKLLVALEKLTPYAGGNLIKKTSWISYGWCVNERELGATLGYLYEIKRISIGVEGSKQIIVIQPNGWEHLERLKQTNPNSNQCFVAMWFHDEMNDAYTKAIKPAIEYIEQGQTKPRFEAIKIDNVEHTNDINDEIIAQIRRSRFMVCDLTGYRGGVYFEAGFAYGLGLEVIYTCRKDWTKEEALKDNEGNEVTSLLDRNGKPVAVKKEGVHFDLAHRNRIEWEPDKLDEFRVKLENRIKAVIT